MNILSIKETCIYVQDLDRTRQFYTSTIGLPLIAMVPERHVFFRAGHSVLLCFLSGKTKQDRQLPPHGAEGHIHFAFEVPAGEYDAAKSFIADQGIVILHEHHWKNAQRSFYFHDPDHHVVEIIEEGVWDI